jgi:hypothetical protein
MYSIAFPEMFNNGGTILVKDSEASASNLKLLLGTWKNSLFGDPYFGTNIKMFIYEQNNIILRDLIIDDIYVSIQQFMPQLAVQRKDIQVFNDGVDVYVTINCINKLDKEVNTYQIKLTSDN